MSLWRLISWPILQRATLLLFLLALILRLLHLGRNPHPDELFHILAARSLLTDGTLVIDGGIPYTRAWPFTYLLAGLFHLFGESLVVARLPGVLAGAALVAGVFGWVRSTVGARAGWAAGLLLSFDPVGIHLSQLGRFYGLHAFFFFLGAVGVYTAATSTSEWRRAAIYGLLAGSALCVALSLQVITILGVCGLLVWLALAKGPALMRWLARARHRGLRAGIAAALVVGAVVLTMKSGLATGLWSKYTYAVPWAEGEAGNPLFYHARLTAAYPMLWSLFPVVVLVGLASAARVTGFCSVVFGTTLVLASFAAQKHDRYLFFILPLFFVLSGIAIGAAIPWLRGSVVSVLRPSWTGSVARRGATATVATLAVVATVLFAVAGHRAFVTTVRMLTERRADAAVYGWHANWSEATRVLRPVADSSAVILSSSPFGARYFLNRLDVSLHSRELITAEGRLPEFTVPAWHLPRPTISKPESLAQVVACQRSGLVFVARRHWRTPWVVSTDLAEYMTAHLEAVPVPETWGLLVFRWQNPPGGPAEACTERSRP